MPELSGVPRREVLRGAAILGVGAAAVPLLAACGSDSPSTATTATEEAVKTSDVKVGGSHVANVDGRKVVITQPTAGDYHAFSAVCTHSGCTVLGVTSDSGGAIKCPCHGSMFSATDGSVVNGPAMSPLATIQVSAKGDELVLG